MSGFRLLSTKLLSAAQKDRLIQTGVSYTEWDFITCHPEPFSANTKDKSLIFTSQNAVKAVFKQQQVSEKNCYCVGEKTKSLLEENGQKVTKMMQNSADLASFLTDLNEKQSFLFFTGNERMPHLEEFFQRKSLPLEIVEVYSSTPQPKVVGDFDGILFYSPNGVRSYLQKNSLNNTLCFAIGPTTAKVLEEHTETIITANQPSVEHLIAAVKNHFTRLV